MESMSRPNPTHFTLLGQVAIPLATNEDLTASYRPTNWSDLSESWIITMYCTTPDNKKPVEMPGVSIKINAEGQRGISVSNE